MWGRNGEYSITADPVGTLARRADPLIYWQIVVPTTNTTRRSCGQLCLKGACKDFSGGRAPFVAGSQSEASIDNSEARSLTQEEPATHLG